MSTTQISYNPIVSNRELGESDPWNWKMPQRNSLMSLSNIDEKKDLVRAKTANGMRTKRQFTANLYVDDIAGSRPKVYAPKDVNKPSHFNDNSDIAGSRPRILHMGMDRGVSGSLRNADIEGSQPDCMKFKTKRPPQNPLNPVYKLQHVEFIPPEPLKFIRD
jgi:hypothetical protein